MSKQILVVVNFGGPRDQEEVLPFLQALLTDKEIIRTPFPALLQDLFFRRVAKKRALTVSKEYEKIGGSPLFADTEWMARQLGERLGMPALAFHRYLTSTHDPFLQRLQEFDPEEIVVFPLFPQFSYATTGSIAKWFAQHADRKWVQRMRWIQSYPMAKPYIQAHCTLLQEILGQGGLQEEEVCFFFSAHGLPQSFIDSGDVYQKECEGSFQAIQKEFPRASCYLSYQSQFGRAKWLEPATAQIARQAIHFLGDKTAIFVPLSFPSDHIETLYEIEELYVKPLVLAGFCATRCPALGRRADWVAAAAQIIREGTPVANDQLVRRR